MAASLAGLAFAAGLASPARADCDLRKWAELPAQIRSLRILTPGKINGQTAIFLVDTGAFASGLTTQVAAERQLPLGPAPYYLEVYGLGGRVHIQIATVKAFTLAETTIDNMEFMVSDGGYGPGVAGVLGLNLFKIGDVEYDLGGHAIRLFKPKGCEQANLAYWAKDRGVSVLDLEPRDPHQPAAIASARVNGARIRVLFDTGAQTSVLTLGAARRIGLTPESPGVVAAGVSMGVDRRGIQTWIAPVESFEVGGEQVKNTHLRIGDIGVAGMEAPDMILGADFFRSHHVLISNTQRKVYFTYEGGPVFDLTTRPQQPAAAATPSPPG